MKGLKIREKWLDLILNKKKVWELRGMNTKIRGKILLIQTATRSQKACIRGEISITGTKKLELSDLHDTTEYHRVVDTTEIKYKRIYAWIFEDVTVYNEPIYNFRNPKGSVIWVESPLGG